MLLKIASVCPVYCRFCFRREVVGPHGDGTLTAAELDSALAYIAGRPEIWEVVVTGGDPFSLSPRRIGELISALAAIEHVRIVRFHTRVPVVDPERVTAAMVQALRAQGVTVWVVLHANHPRELAPAARAALGRLVDGGVPLLSQSVLLRGVNDDPAVLGALLRALVACGWFGIQTYIGGEAISAMIGIVWPGWLGLGGGATFVGLTLPQRPIAFAAAVAFIGFAIWTWRGKDEPDDDPGAPVAETCNGKDDDCDGTVDDGEACDDGVAMSATDPDACRPGCIAPRCGDSIQDSNEECDNGASNSNTVVDACRTNCRDAGCGDDIIDSGEVVRFEGNVVMNLVMDSPPEEPGSETEPAPQPKQHSGKSANTK